MLMKIRIVSFTAVIFGLLLFILAIIFNIVMVKHQFSTLPLIIAAAGSVGIIVGLVTILFLNIRLHVGNIERRLKSMQSAIMLSKTCTVKPVFFSRHAAEADFIELITEIIRRRKVSSVLELGSGTTTHYIANLLSSAKKEGILLSLEENSVWAQLVKSEIGIENIDRANNSMALVNVVYAPLMPYSDSNLLFYDMRFLSNLARDKINKFDLIVVDGPGDVVHRRVAFDALRTVISDSTVMILDDGDHPHVRETVQLWLKKEPSLQARYYDTVKGTWIIFRPEAKTEMNLPLP